MTTDPAQRAAAAATPDLGAAWQRDGAVCLRGLLTADELAQRSTGSHFFRIDPPHVQGDGGSLLH